MPLYVPLSSSELLHTRGSKADKADEEGKSFYKMTIFLFLHGNNKQTTLRFWIFSWWFEEMPLLAAENGYDQVSIGLKIPAFLTSSKMVISQNESFALQIKTFLWKACLCLCEVFADIIFLWKVRLQVYILFWWKEFEVSNVMQTLSLF